MANAVERLHATLRGESVHPPLNYNIMMTYAAHFIGQPLNRYYQDCRVLCDANFAVQREFDLDILQTISDPYREAADLGSAVEFPEDDLPILHSHLLSQRQDIVRLRLVDPSSGPRMSDRLEAIRLLQAEAGGEIPVMGWVEGALAEAADLRGVSHLMTDLYDDPIWVEELLEFCTQQAILFARAQVEAGADIIGMGDAVASQISPAMYERYALLYEKRIFAAVQDMGALARLHICGNTSRLLSLMPQSGADIIDIDWMVPIDKAAQAFGEVAVCGNFDPVAVMLQGTPDDVRQATLDCASRGGSRFISAAGCEIPDGTPVENLHAQTAALRSLAPS